MQICGIDEAGRGSMLGPLVIAGISLEKKNLRKLTSL
ncbi:MAG: ribonuclease HII, partial [Thaumarchaeota archaeon]